MSRRAIRAWESFWPTLIIWLPLVSILLLTDARIPHIPPADNEPPYRIFRFLDRIEITLALLVIVAEFLMIKSLLMARTYVRLPSRENMTARMENGTVSVIYDKRKKGDADYLALGLIAANVAFTVLYLLSIILLLHPNWLVRYPIQVRTATNLARLGLVIVLAWGGYQLLSVADPDREDRISPAGIVATFALIAQVIAVYAYVTVQWTADGRHFWYWLHGRG